MDGSVSDFLQLDSVTAPLADNSDGSPDMQPATPTGLGSGQFFDMTASQLLGTALNYTLKKDQLQYSQTHVPTVGQASALQQQATMSRNSGILLVGALIIGVMLIAHKA